MTTTSSPERIYDNSDEETNEDLSSDEDGIEWTNQVAKELHKPVIRKFRKGRVFTPGVNWIWACDLADLSKYKRFNNGYKYLLCVIDTFSEFRYLVPMKLKNAEETA